MSGSDAPCRNKMKEVADCDVDLARDSVSIALYLEVLPLEAGILWSLVYSPPIPYNILLMLAVKAICVTLIFAPLAVYVQRNGLRALKLVAGRVTVVAAIVALNLGCLVMMLLVVLRRAEIF